MEGKASKEKLLAELIGKDMSYMDVLRFIDSEIKTVPVGVRDGVFRVFAEAWRKTFPKNSISDFLENVKEVYQKLLESEELTFLEDYYVRTICFKVAEQISEKEGIL